MPNLNCIVTIALLCYIGPIFGQNLAVLQYDGGGDWYSNPTALPNLIQFCNKEIKTNMSAEPKTVSAIDQSVFDYPLLHMTGHGNVVFSQEDIDNLRLYLLGGGFYILMIIME